MTIEQNTTNEHQRRGFFIFFFLGVGMLSLISWMIGVKSSFMPESETVGLLLLLLGLIGFSLCIFSALYMLAQKRRTFIRLSDSYNQTLYTFFKHIIFLQILMITVVYTFFTMVTGWIIVSLS